MKENGTGGSSTSVDITLTSSGWSNNYSPYTQTVAIDNLSASQDGILAPAQGLTVDQMTEIAEAMLGIYSQSNGSMVIAAYGWRPDIDLPVKIMIFG